MPLTAKDMETIRSIGRQYSNSKRTTHRDSDGDGDGKGEFKAADVLDLHYALNYLLRWECFNNCFIYYLISNEERIL